MIRFRNDIHLSHSLYMRILMPVCNSVETVCCMEGRMV